MGNCIALIDDLFIFMLKKTMGKEQIAKNLDKNEKRKLKMIEQYTPKQLQELINVLNVQKASVINETI
jgi:hypothetical protein